MQLCHNDEIFLLFLFFFQMYLFPPNFFSSFSFWNFGFIFFLFFFSFTNLMDSLNWIHRFWCKLESLNLKKKIYTQSLRQSSDARKFRLSSLSNGKYLSCNCLCDSMLNMIFIVSFIVQSILFGRFFFSVYSFVRGKRHHSSKYLWWFFIFFFSSIKGDR